MKPSAANYNMAREDLEHVLKFGTSLWGEMFVNGMRLPRKDGARHKEDFPTGAIPRVDGMGDAMWTLRDAAEREFAPPPSRSSSLTSPSPTAAAVR